MRAYACIMCKCGGGGEIGICMGGGGAGSMVQRGYHCGEEAPFCGTDGIHMTGTRTFN